MSNTHAQEGIPSLETVIKRRARGPNKAPRAMDAEAAAISACSKALTGLDPKAVERVLAYVAGRFKGDKP